MYITHYCNMETKIVQKTYRVSFIDSILLKVLMNIELTRLSLFYERRFGKALDGTYIIKQVPAVYGDIRNNFHFSSIKNTLPVYEPTEFRCLIEQLHRSIFLICLVKTTMPKHLKPYQQHNQGKIKTPINVIFSLIMLYAYAKKDINIPYKNLNESANKKTVILISIQGPMY